MPAGQIIKVRRGTAAAWTSGNPTLAAGEPGYETDTGKIKIGDGSTAWNSLAYRFTGAVTFGTPAITLGTSAAAGSIDEPIRRDSTIVAFDATVPVTQAFGDSAATGSAAVAARRDHKHAMPANPLIESGGPTTLAFGAIPDGDLLQRSGSSIIGVAPASASAMTLICDQLLTGSQATFDTNTILSGNIPGTYKHLQFMLYGAETGSENNGPVAMTFNNDTTSGHYIWADMQGNAAASIASGGNTSDNKLAIANFPGSTATPTGTAAQTTCAIDNYAQAVFNKTYVANAMLIRAQSDANAFLFYYAGQWKSTAAITRIILTPNLGSFATGSRFSLYGIS